MENVYYAMKTVAYLLFVLSYLIIADIFKFNYIADKIFGVSLIIIFTYDYWR